MDVRRLLDLNQWRRRLKRRLGKYLTPVGSVDFGSLRRLSPISIAWGSDRGMSICRYYIDKFVQSWAADIQGRVLEIGDPGYTNKFGGDKVIQSDVLHATPGNPEATIVADLTSADHIPSNTFDCVILTQTLQFIYDFRSALRTVYRILAPGGVLLATFHGISQISRYDMVRWGEYWRFTTLSIKMLFEELFPPQNLTIKAQGNVLTAICFLHGLSIQELSQEELDYHDPDYELLITLRAVRPQDTSQ
jgi:SAM-dependent methyltransferase